MIFSKAELNSHWVFTFEKSIIKNLQTKHDIRSKLIIIITLKKLINFLPASLFLTLTRCYGYFCDFAVELNRAGKYRQSYLTFNEYKAFS